MQLDKLRAGLGAMLSLEAPPAFKKQVITTGLAHT